MIYFAQPVDGGPVKIGTTEDVETRLRALEGHYGCRLALLATRPGGREEEQAIHARFSHLRFGRTEQFRPASELMAFRRRPLLVGANPDTVESLPPATLKNVVVLRGTEEWKAWLDELAEANSAPLTVTIEQALKRFAEKLNVRKPPRRVP